MTTMRGMTGSSCVESIDAALAAHARLAESMFAGWGGDEEGMRNSQATKERNAEIEGQSE